MMDQELVLRFIGFYLIYNQQYSNLKYIGKMDEFLDDVVEILNNNLRILPIKQIKEDFYKSMKSAVIMFNSYAFRKIEINYKANNKNMINKSLFTCLSVLICKYDSKEVIKKGLILDSFAKAINTDKYLYDSISYATNDAMRIDTAFLKIENFLKGIYE
ncbi:hypothetical protein [Anaerovorax odorimutans]|uniref:hypothetical protein n=1 Tax=Anaerovorax odorimutans TaxID=109327 RepID=UPI000485B1C1|nr:hypothetical protein [Anaerovorax odorimutans]